MSKNAKKLLKGLERSQEISEDVRSSIKAVIGMTSSGVDLETCNAFLDELETYLKANARLQQAINTWYGDSPREIAVRAINNRKTIQN